MEYGKNAGIILEEQENILWEGVINRRVLVFNLVFGIAIALVFSGIFFSKETIEYTVNGVPKASGGFFVGLSILGLGLVFSLISFFSSYVKKYFITDKKVIIKSGIIGTDFNSIYLTQIKTANVNVGILDKIFSSGTINLDTGKVETVTDDNGRSSGTRTAYDKLLHIDTPYEVYKYFQEAVSQRQESLYSGRADMENNTESYKKTMNSIDN